MTFRRALAGAVCVAVLLGAVSCKRQAAPVRETVPFVKSLLAHAPGTPWALVQSFDPAGREGAIYVIGPEETASVLVQDLLSSDRFDNVTGRPVPDGLPDFAGETVILVSDLAATPYDRYERTADVDVLREAVVRSVVAALDTVAYVSPYDQEGSGVRPRAKLIVLASPFMSAYGKFDVDTLFKASGVSNPAVFPCNQMLERCVKKHGESARIAFAGVPGECSQQVYETIAGRPCAVVPLDASAPDPFRSFMDAYAASCENPEPLDVLLVDNPAVDVCAMRASCDTLVSVMNESSLVYGHLVAPGFEIVGSCETVAQSCYAALRSRGAFTHGIRYPAAGAYKLLEYSDRYVQE